MIIALLIAGLLQIQPSPGTLIVNTPISSAVIDGQGFAVAFPEAHTQCGIDSSGLWCESFSW